MKPIHIALALGAFALFVMRDRLGAFMQFGGGPGEASFANPFSRTADAIARGFSGASSGTVGTISHDLQQQLIALAQQRGPVAPSGNFVSQTVDSWARALTPSAAPTATVGTMLYDWLHPPTPTAPVLSKAMAEIIST